MALDDPQTELVQLPPYLLHPEPLDVEALPLQVHLLMLELAEIRKSQARMARAMAELANHLMPAPPL